MIPFEVRRVRHMVRSRERVMDVVEEARLALMAQVVAGVDFYYTDDTSHSREDLMEVLDMLVVMRLEENSLRPMRHLKERRG